MASIKQSDSPTQLGDLGNFIISGVTRILLDPHALSRPLPLSLRLRSWPLRILFHSFFLSFFRSTGFFASSAFFFSLSSLSCVRSLFSLFAPPPPCNFFLCGVTSFLYLLRPRTTHILPFFFCPLFPSSPSLSLCLSFRTSLLLSLLVSSPHPLPFLLTLLLNRPH